jgi:hypothetical protein
MLRYKGEVILNQPTRKQSPESVSHFKYSMMYRLTTHRGGDDNFLRFAIFPIRDTNLEEVNH